MTFRTNTKFLKHVLLGVILLLVTACGESRPKPGPPDPNLSGTMSGNISGTVINRLGAPVAGVRIATIPETTFAISSADGGFVLTGIPAGTYDIVASKNGYATTTTDDVTTSQNTNANLTITLFQEDGIITGTITNTKNVPLESVAVEVIDETSLNIIGAAKTDVSGRFFIPSLPTGAYTVRGNAANPDYAPNEKTHLQVSGTNSLHMILSGMTPESARHIGSTGCQTCHAKQYENYRQTSHFQVLKTPAEMNPAAINQFQNGTVLAFNASPAGNPIPVEITLLTNINGQPAMTLNGNGPHEIQKIYGGHRWKENYITKINDQEFVLPLAWSVQQGIFVLDPEVASQWFVAGGFLTTPTQDQSYVNQCVGCHVTGFEANIGCERCHGPGSSHKAIAETAKPDDSLLIVQPRYLSLKGNAQVCGQCHSKGHDKNYAQASLAWPISVDGLPYLPGKELDDYFVASNDKWSVNDTSKSFHQEYDDFLKSKHYSNTIYNPRCSDCHDLHGPSGNENPSLLKYPAKDNTLCLNCHTTLNFPDTAAIQIHTQHPYDPGGSGASRCIGCHLTKTGTAAQFTDVGGHTFSTIHPETTLGMLIDIKSRGQTTIQESDLIPNPCMQCHNAVVANANANGTVTNALGGNPTSQNYLDLLSKAFDYKFNVSKKNGKYASFTHKLDPGWKDKNSTNHHGRYYLGNPETCTNACHGKNLEGGRLSDGSVVPSCFDCHYAAPHSKRMELDAGLQPDGRLDWGWLRRHKYYFTETACTPCHGEDYAGGISGVSCARCHSNPGVDFTQFNQGCKDQACHGTPPLIGAHNVHYNGVYYENAENPKYGDTQNYSATDAYRFGCGTCHPMNQDQHRNGKIEIELYNETAPQDTLKSKMSPAARFDPITRTCANVYCHSGTEYVGAGGGPVTVPFPLQPDEVNTLAGLEGQISEFNGENFKTVSSYFIWNNFEALTGKEADAYWSLPLLLGIDSLCRAGSTDTVCTGGYDANGVRAFDYNPSRFGYGIKYPAYTAQKKRKYKNTPNWDGEENLACNGCHEFPPRSYMTHDEWDPNDPNWENKKPQILMEAAIDKHSFIIPKLTPDGKIIEVGHMANMSPFSNAPLRCQVCHFETVSKVKLADWEAGRGWSHNNGVVEISNASINDRKYHVNGQVDVIFDQSQTVTSYRFNNKSYGFSLKPHPLKEQSNKNSNMFAYSGLSTFYGIKGKKSAGAKWNPVTKTCSNVSCHLEQTKVKWTNPYRPYNRAECYQCHQYASDPNQGENDAMCWPHAERNGCED